MKRSRQIILTLIMTVSLVGLSWYAGRTQPRQQTTSVVMAGEWIEAGRRISGEQLTTVDLPADCVSDAWVTGLEEAVGFHAAVDLPAGTLLLRERLTEKPSGIDYPGGGTDRRLMTIALDPADANGFWLTDGSRIDLYLIGKQGQSSFSMQVMKSVKIVKVMKGDRVDGNSQSALRSPLLCLDLSVSQAEQLALAMETCVLRVAAVSENKQDPAG